MTAGVDHWLDEFGGDLDPIYSRARHVKGPKSARSPKGSAGSTKIGGPATRESRRATLARTVRKAPEVMVKITGGGRNIDQIKRHMDYISRNGRVELEDEQGLVYLGKDRNHVRDAWRDGGHTVPLTGEDGRREAFNIMLSMPPGTNRQAVKDAARAFAADEFQGFQYAFAAHDDEKHPHVHLTVKAAALDGTRLNPRKGDLHRWRVKFAEQLRAQGIEANATPRKARGVVRKAQRQAVRGIVERGGRSRVMRKHQAEAIREARGRAPHPNPAQDKISVNRRSTLQGYGELAKALARGSAEDRALALQIVDFVKTMPAPTTAHEERVQAYRAEHAENRQKSGRDRLETDRGRNDKGRA